MITFRDSGSPAKEVTGAVFIIAGGLTLDDDGTGLPRLTLTASGVGGSGTPNRIPKWTGSSTLGDSLLSDDGSNVTLTSGQLIFSAAASQVRPGATSLAFRNNANSANNILIADSGAITFRAGLSGITTLSMSGQLTSTLATGTAPFAVSSTTVVTNLNADMVDGVHASALIPSGTSGTIAKFTSTSTIGDSIITEAGSLISIAGALTVSNTIKVLTATAGITGLQLEVSTATSNTPGIRWVMNSVDQAGIRVNSSGQLVIGTGWLTDRWIMDTSGNWITATDNALDMGASGSGRPRNLFLANSLQMGNTPATTGMIRLPNNQGIYGRNAANSANVLMLFLTTANNVQLGDSNSNEIQILPGAGVAWRFTTGSQLIANTDDTATVGSSGFSINSVFVGSGGLIGIKASSRIKLGGTSVNTNVGVYLTNSVSLNGSTSAYGIFTDATYDLTAVTNTAIGVYARLNTSATAATLSGAYGMRVATPILGSGSSITNAFGLYIEAQTVAATNYAIYTNAGTNVLQDITRIGTVSPGSNILFAVTGTAATPISNSTQLGMLCRIIANSTGTSSVEAFRADPQTAAASFTVASLYGVRILDATKGAGSTITTQYGLHIASQTQGTTNYAIYTNTGLSRFGDDIQINSLGRFDSTAVPSADQSLVYDSSAGKWRPRLITASIASSGVVNSSVLPDGTAAMLVNTTSAALSGTPATPTSLGIQSGYKCFILTMAGIAANQIYAPEYSTLPNTVSGTATGAQSSTTLQDTSKSWTTNQWAGYWVYLVSGTGNGQWRYVSSNTSNTLTVLNAWGTTPVSASTTYEVSGFRVSLLGTASAGSANTITSSTSSWETNALAAYTVLIRSGTGAGQFRTVISNTSTQMIVSPNWSTNPDATSTFIVGPILSTADSVVHGNLDDTKTYYYRYRIIGSTASSYYPTSPTGNTVSTASQVVAYGLVLASQIAVGNLSAIAASASSLVVGSLTSSASLFRQWQSSATTSFGQNTAPRLWVDGPTLEVRGDTSNNDTSRVILGTYSYAAGALTTVTDSTWSTNSPSITISANTGGAFVSASSQPANAVTPATAAYDNKYIVSGNMRLTCTMTATSVVNLTNIEGRVEMEYNIDGGAWSSPIIVASVAEAGLILNADNNYAWSYSLYLPSLTASHTLNIRLTYKGSITCGKVNSGSFTVAGDSGVGGISIVYYTATANARRGLYISGLNSQPQISLQPIATAPTSGNSQNGELWFNDSNDSLEYNSNGTVIVLNDATGSRNGLVRLTGCLGGTATSPTVIGLQGSSTTVTINSANASAAGQALITTSTTAATWTAVTDAVQFQQKRVSFYVRARANNNQMVGSGCYDPTNGTNGASSSVTAASDDNQNYVLLTGSNGVGNYARVTSAGSGGSAIFDECQTMQSPTFMCLVKTGSSVTGLRLYAGLTDGHQTGATASGNYIGFRSSGGALVGVCAKAGTESTTSTIATMTTSNNVYLLKVRCVSNTAFFSVNGGAETSLSTNFPNTANTPVGWTVSAIDTSNDAIDVVMSLGYVYVEYGV